MGVIYNNYLTSVEGLRSGCFQKQICATEMSSTFGAPVMEIMESLADYNSIDHPCRIWHIQ